jgi:hypothetical protein
MNHTDMHKPETAPEEVDEFSPENLTVKARNRRLDEIETDCMGNCFSDADPGL